MPLIVAAALAAWFGMDDLGTVKASFETQAVIVTRKHTWILSWLYLGTFGSFIGFAAGFPLVAEMEFGATETIAYAYLGPLAGALARPLGGYLADRHGGARIALAAFGAMALSVTAMLAGAAIGAHGYAAFLVLFVDPVRRERRGQRRRLPDDPAVFVADRRRALAGQADARARALREGTIEGAATLGFASAIAAFGGFFVPKAYGTALAVTGGTAAALVPFLVFYLSCGAVTWWYSVTRRYLPLIRRSDRRTGPFRADR